MDMTGLDRRLQAQLLAGRRVEGDRLVLADTVLLGALDGSRPLTAGERAALQASPLTTRRLQVLAGQRRAAAAPASWSGSAGMLRAADGGAVLDTLVTDDGAWRLHFVQDRVILQLDPQSRLAATLLRGLQPEPQATAQPQYALEGSVFIGGAVVQWLRDGLKAIASSSDVQDLAASVPDSGGVVFVPAFTGWARLTGMPMRAAPSWA